MTIVVPLISSTSVKTHYVRGPILLALLSSTAIYTPGVGQPTEAAGADNPEWEVRIVNIYGATQLVVPSANPERIRKTLGQTGSASFSFPKHAYEPDDIPILGVPAGTREAQIYFDGDLMFWGPIIAADASSGDGAVHCNCAAVDWYLERRAIDGARTNRLTNASFESDTTGWTATGVTAAVTSDTKERGTQAVRLTQSTVNADAYLAQSYNEVAGGIGVLLTVVGWFYVEDFDGTALDSRGLFVQGTMGGQVQKVRYYPIDNATPRNQWKRAKVEIWVRPNETWAIEVRAYGPAGSILWDALQCVAMESVSTAGLTGSTTAEADLADIFAMLVRHAQSTAVGKSDVNIAPDATLTGVKMARHWQYAEHVAYDQAVAELTGRADGIDVSTEITPTTRTVKTHYPRMGVDRSATVTLQWGGTDPNCASYTFHGDGAQTVTRATVLGPGDGPDREEGEYADATEIGGLILQDISSPPPDATIASIDALAEETVNQKRKPVRVVTMKVTDRTLWHVLREGDLVTAVIDDGWVQVSSVWRVVDLVIDCRPRMLDVTLNEEAA